MKAFSEHEARYALTNELHARPMIAASAPTQAVHLALLTEEGSAARDRAHLEALCKRFGVHPPAADASHFIGEFGAFRVKWERHTEFVTYTFVKDGAFDAPFEVNAESLTPADWLAAMPGELLVATQVTIIGPKAPDPSAEDLGKWLSADSTVSSLVSGGAAQMWSDLRIHPSGYNRILVKDRELNPRQAGRLLQRLLEIATYRNMALLALPVAREVGPKLARIDAALAALTGEMRATGADRATDDALLKQLTELSAEVEAISAQAAYRFSAARAYATLVDERLAELRETRVADYQNLGEFLSRRLGPAMRTCESVWDRLERLAKRASRVANLLRTRVDYALEEQNQKLLVSMDRRARVQLRLQETVEGLSVAAISYYLVGLIGHAAKALQANGVAIDPDTVSGLAIPVVVILVWGGVRHLRKSIAGIDKAEAEGPG